MSHWPFHMTSNWLTPFKELLYLIFIFSAIPHTPVKYQHWTEKWRKDGGDRELISRGGVESWLVFRWEAKDRKRNWRKMRHLADQCAIMLILLAGAWWTEPCPVTFLPPHPSLPSTSFHHRILCGALMCWYHLEFSGCMISPTKGRMGLIKNASATVRQTELI